MKTLDKMIEDSNEELTAALTQVREYYKHRIIGPDLQWGPTAEVCARIYLGERPKDIAPMLTRKEASQWAYQTEHRRPEKWLWAQLCAEHPQLEVSHTDHIEVMRWAARMMESKTRREAMLLPRQVFGELGDQGGHDPDDEDDDEQGHDLSCVAQRLDEILPQDLVDSPSETLQRAANRQMREQWDGPDELRPHEPWMDELPEGCTLLRTWPQLFREGIEMRHCVAQYAQSVADRRSSIVSIVTEDGRSTAEYQDAKLVQHQSRARGAPKASCVELAKSLQGKIR